MNTRVDFTAFERDETANAERLPLTRLGAPLLYAYEASTFVKRLKGLHAHPPLGPSDALVIRPCRSIQTYGMKYAIDVAFLDSRGVIQKVVTLPPSRSSWCFRACIAVEMCAGAATRLDLHSGQQLLPRNGSWS